LTQGRALGISFVIVENVTSRISLEAQVSPHLIAVFCTSSPELWASAKLLGLGDRRQIEQLQALGKGECIITLTGDRCPTPLRLRLPKPQIDRRNLTREEREFCVSRSLEDQLPKVLPRYTGFTEERQAVKKRESDPNRLSRNAWRVFVHIADNPTAEIEERCSDLHLNRAEEESARREYINKGYVQEAGGYGRGIKLFELTQKGRAFAEEHNVPVRPFQSGVVHESLLDHVVRGISKAYPALRWTSATGAAGSTRPDHYGLFPGGRTICLQIHWRNEIDYEVGKLMDLCAIHHVDLVVLVAATKKAVAGISLEILKRWREEVPKRYVLLSATECLAPDFDWKRALETPT
jgi:hypothetical protein